MSATRDDLPITYNQDTNQAQPFHTSSRLASEVGRDPDKDKRRWCHLLDSRTPRHPKLDALMDLALSRILLTADGATMQLKVKIRGSATRSAAPVSSLAGDIDQLAQDYTAAKTHRARLQVIKAAQDMGTQLRYAPDRSKVKGTQEWREAIATDPRPCRQLAVIYGVSHMTVYRIQKAGKPM